MPLTVAGAGASAPTLPPPPPSSAGVGASPPPSAAAGRTATSGAAGAAGKAPIAAGGAGAPATGAAGANASAGMGGSAGMIATAAGAGGKPMVSPPTPTKTGTGPAQTKPLGYGQATTGGGNAPAKEVANLAAMQAAVDAYSGSGGLVLKYTGKFDFASISDPCNQHTLDAQKLEIKKKNDITILGADGSAANFGIHISASSSNVIVRNMTIGLLPGGGDSDMISLEGMSGGFPNNVWIDHNELFSTLKECPGTGDTAFDGMIDIKKGADHVTISYNYLHDHHKACLNGYSDDDDMPRHVTFHHNVFENIGSRTPLQRHGFSHMLNNKFTKVVTSGINVRMGGHSLVEANYFEDVLNPVTSRDSDAIGYWELRNNNLASQADVAPGNPFGISWDKGNDGTVNATDWTTTQVFPEPLGYDYEPLSFACVRDGLRAVVGPGKGLATLTCD